MKSKVNKILIGVIVLLVGTMGYLSYRYVVVLNEKPKCDDIVVDDNPSRDLTEDEVEPLYNILATFGDNRRPNQFFKNSKVLFKDLDDGTYGAFSIKERAISGTLSKHSDKLSLYSSESTIS